MENKKRSSPPVWAYPAAILLLTLLVLGQDYLSQHHQTNSVALETHQEKG